MMSRVWTTSECGCLLQSKNNDFKARPLAPNSNSRKPSGVERRDALVGLLLVDPYPRFLMAGWVEGDGLDSEGRHATVVARRRHEAWNACILEVPECQASCNGQAHAVNWGERAGPTDRQLDG
jgi:hypothetical protein